jgi:hypothetical protein
LTGVDVTEPAEAKSKLIADLLVVADSYCATGAVTRASLSKTLFGRGGHLDDLASGARDLATGTFERAMLWMSANWPAATEWPSGIPRPIAEAA